ncbi:MAG: zf-HC2 domain-containing protein [Anaerolineales bacterium]|nr:zf-HC2 domain-containing protein [Anaerolineales bacterium]
MTHLTEAQLNKYFDQMLRGESRRQIETHIAVCEQCRAQANEMQSLFAALADLPETPLTRDLTQDILTHLSQNVTIPTLWRQPAFVAQSVLTVLLLAISMPMLNALRLPLTAWRATIVFPTIQLPSWAEIITQITPLLIWKRPFTFTVPKISLVLPTIPVLPDNADANMLVMLIVAAGILWMVGNITLLRSRPGGKK